MYRPVIFSLYLLIYTIAHGETTQKNTTLKLNKKNPTIQIINNNNQEIQQQNTSTSHTTLATTHPKSQYNATKANSSIKNNNSLITLAKTILQYKITASIGILGSLYGIVLAHTIAMPYRLTRKDSWALWKSEIPLYLLEQIEVSVMREELYEKILCKYNASCTLNALTLFAQDVDKELEYIHHCIARNSFITRIQLSFLFPENSIALENAHTYRARLLFLKDIINNWITASFKLTPEAIL